MNDGAPGVYAKMASEPRVPMTLRIGVAGHRELPQDQLDRIRRQLSECYAAVHGAIRSAASTDVARHLYAPAGDPVIRLISSLAEGADRLCIEPDVVPFEHELAALLPFPSEIYEIDFSPQNSVVCSSEGSIAEYHALLEKLDYGSPGAQIIELDGDRTDTTGAYDACGDLLVEHSDMLFAVYDGNHCVDHGTSYVVDAARKASIPVVHVSTSGESPVLYVPAAPAGRGRLPFTEDAVRQEIHRIVLFEDLLRGATTRTEQARAKVLSRFDRYAGGDKLYFDPETAPDFDVQGPIAIKRPYRNVLARAFNQFKRWVASPSRVAASREKHRWETAARDGTIPEATDIPTRASDRFYAAFLRADHLARYYSNVHRSTFLLIYCLAAAALTSAVLSLALKPYLPGTVPYIVASELLLLGVIYRLFRQDHRCDYHDRWLEYRCLAELLRPMVYLSLLGKSYRPMRARNAAGGIDRELVGHHSVARGWIYIYSETLVRWTGFGNVRLTADRKNQVAGFVIDKWLDGQIVYHIDNASTMQVLGERLGRWSKILFFVTVAAVVLKLIDISLFAAIGVHSEAAALVLGLTVAICPILATAAFAIRNHAEFDISAQRSLTMRSLLISKQREMKAVPRDEPVTSLAAKLETIARITAADAADWLEIYEVKESEPA